MCKKRWVKIWIFVILCCLRILRKLAAFVNFFVYSSYQPCDCVILDLVSLFRERESVRCWILVIFSFFFFFWRLPHTCSKLGVVTPRLACECFFFRVFYYSIIILLFLGQAYFDFRLTVSTRKWCLSVPKFSWQWPAGAILVEMLELKKAVCWCWERSWNLLNHFFFICCFKKRSLQLCSSCRQTNLFQICKCW